MAQKQVILRFENVTYGYDEEHLLMDAVNFSVRENSKITIMGQNGAGKSTLLKMITGELKPLSGSVHVQNNATIAIAEQVLRRDFFEDTTLDYLARAFDERPYNLEGQVKGIFERLGFDLPLSVQVKNLSGGQKARLLLAQALLKNPDILLLDEPTNNLDAEGIATLTGFLMMYEKTVIVISHDADFLNAFTEGVLYLDLRTKKVEQYVGNYFNVVEEIKAAVERDQRKNSQLLRSIQDKKDKVNFFAHKGGKMRRLAAKLREEIEDEEDSMVNVRQEDKTIYEFEIPAQEFSEAMVRIESVHIMNGGEPLVCPHELELRRGDKLRLVGPNGIGKTTLLDRIAKSEEEGVFLHKGLKVGYYRQDFMNLDPDKTGFEILSSAMGVPDAEDIFRTGAQFLLKSKILNNKVGTYSEGQKGLLAFARFVLLEPGLLILDEPTNHINFRHLPVIANAISEYQGAVIMVSHMDEFAKQVRVNSELDLEWLRDKTLRG